MKGIMQDIVNDILVNGVKMNEKYPMQDRTVKMGAFCPISKDIETFYKPEFEEVTALGKGERSYLINSFEEIGWPDPFPTPQAMGNFKETSINISSDKVSAYLKSAKEINENKLIDESLFKSQRMDVSKLNIAGDSELEEEQLDLVYKHQRYASD